MDEKDELKKRVKETIFSEPAQAAPEEAEEEKGKRVPWAKLLTNLSSQTASKEKEVEKRLRANDINTYQDAASNPNVVINILRDVYGADYGRLMEAAKEHEDATNR